MFTWLHNINFVIDVETIDLSTGEPSRITCGDHAVIRIDHATVHAHKSYCSTNMNNECVLSNDDLESIETRCNNNSECTVNFPKDTSCLKEDRYFNLSYSCLGNCYIFLYCTVLNKMRKWDLIVNNCCKRCALWKLRSLQQCSRFASLKIKFLNLYIIKSLKALKSW